MTSPLTVLLVLCCAVLALLAVYHWISTSTAHRELSRLQGDVAHLLSANTKLQELVSVYEKQQKLLYRELTQRHRKENPLKNRKRKEPTNETAA